MILGHDIQDNRLFAIDTGGAAIIEEVALLHMDVFSVSEYMNVRLGIHYVRNMVQWFAKDPSSLLLVELRGGRLVGYACGSPEGYRGRFERGVSAALVTCFLTKPWLVFDGPIIGRIVSRIPAYATNMGRRALGLKTEQLNRAADLESLSPYMSLVSIAIDFQMRRSGKGRQLLEHFVMHARSLGLRGVVLSVYESNSAAQAFYEKSGWKVLSSNLNGKRLVYAHYT